LRDHSRIVKPPRKLHLINIKVQKERNQNPNISYKEIAEKHNLSLKDVEESQKAMLPSGIIFEENHYDDTNILTINGEKQSSTIDNNFKIYKNELLKKLSNLPEEDYNFLTDLIEKKRVTRTLMKKYKLKNKKEIEDKKQQLLEDLFQLFAREYD
jgi:DNA-binding Lrp family transcriptional regulator